MPWEQRGGEATAATDVCAASALLFEAVTGRRWNFAAPPDRADWSDVPRSIRGVLREGLAFNPGQRPHAEALRDALKEPRSLGRLALYGLGIAAAGLAGNYVFQSCSADPPFRRRRSTSR